MTVAHAHTHHGSISDIPASSSPGLIFLKKLLPTLDSLDPTIFPELQKLIRAGALFRINDNEPMAVENVQTMLEKRSHGLSKFEHRLHSAWDIENAGRADRRTVMYESTSITVFKKDPEAREVSVKEFNIIELAKVGDDGSKGVGGWVATELRTYMDASAVMNRAVDLQKADN